MHAVRQDINSNIERKEDVLDIIFQNKDFVLLNKKRGVPSAPLKKGDDSLLTIFLEHSFLKEKVCGKKEVEGGLLHRLDTPTTGLILIAKNQNIYDALAYMQDRDMMEKEYLAICDVVPNQATYYPHITYQKSYCGFSVSSSFLPYGRRGARVKMYFPYDNAKKDNSTAKKFKKYTTRVLIKEKSEVGTVRELFLSKHRPCESERHSICCQCTLTKGYRHQVRCHLASIGLPIKGDGLYNSTYIEENAKDIEKLISSHSYPLELYATRISFPSPYNDNCKLSFSLLPLNRKSL